MTRDRLAVMAAAIGVAVLGSRVEATEALVGVNPPDGATALVKRFHVSAGTTVVGAAFGNNDSRTVFPEVLLVRGAGITLGEGAVVATATNVVESAPGQVAAAWDPISVTEEGDYLVVIRFPRGSRKQGPGTGAALRAFVGGDQHQSLIAGPDGTLNKISVDLDVSLLTGNAAAKTALPAPPDTDQERVRETFLAQSGPHPAVSIVKVRFGIGHAGFADLTIYDIAGRQVRSLVRGHFAAGEQAVDWDGRDDRRRTVAAGVYFARLRADGKIITQKMVLAK